MFKDLFSNRLLIGALAFFILCVGGSLLYQQSVKRQVAEQMAKEMILKPKEPPKPTIRPPLSTWKAEPHDPSSEVPSVNPVTRPVDVSESRGVKWEDAHRAMHTSKGAGNPHPFQNVPVDLWDFEATKAAMIENINFVKANWDPKVYNREVSIADSLTANISNAAMSPEFGLFTPEQCKELRALRMDLLAFKGIERGRAKALQEQGYTLDEALKIATDETLQRWRIK